MKAFKVKVGDIHFSNDLPLKYIAGTCVIESEENYFLTIKRLKKIYSELGSPYIAKASFDKANRTSINSFRGPGLEKGIEILKRVKEKLKVPLLVDIHLPSQAEKIAQVADIIQIPAFLCRQTDLVVAAASTGKAVNIKKGQFLSPWEMESIIKKIESQKNYSILLTERGTTFGYSNLVVDMRSIEIMKSFGYPVIFDCTHSVQKPGAVVNGNIRNTGGDRIFAFPLAKASVALGIAGIFFETHINPDVALSDSANSLPLSKVKDISIILNELDKLVKSFKEVKI